jgi:hypothetical protein
MGTNVYASTVRATGVRRDILRGSFVTLFFVLAVAALSVGTLLALVRWPF